MAIRQGNSDVSALYLGSTEITKVYKGATEIYSAAPAPSSLISLDNLEFYFPFNGTAVDESGNANTTSQATTSFGPGQFGQAMAVNGSAANITILNPKVWNIANAYSLAAWINTPAYSSDNDHIFGADGGPNPRVFQVKERVDGEITFIRFNSSNGVETVISGGSLLLNTWQHIAVTFSNVNGSKVYVNGIEVASDSNLNSNNNAQTPIYIGDALSAGLPFGGSIDEAMLYSRELTPAEISTLAAGTAPLIS